MNWSANLKWRIPKKMQFFCGFKQQGWIDIKSRNEYVRGQSLERSGQTISCISVSLHFLCQLQLMFYHVHQRVNSQATLAWNTAYIFCNCTRSLPTRFSHKVLNTITPSYWNTTVLRTSHYLRAQSPWSAEVCSIVGCWLAHRDDKADPFQLSQHGRSVHQASSFVVVLRFVWRIDCVYVSCMFNILLDLTCGAPSTVQRFCPWENWGRSTGWGLTSYGFLQVLPIHGPENLSIHDCWERLEHCCNCRHNNIDERCHPFDHCISFCWDGNNFMPWRMRSMNRNPFMTFLDSS